MLKRPESLRVTFFATRSHSSSTTLFAVQQSVLIGKNRWDLARDIQTFCPNHPGEYFLMSAGEILALVTALEYASDHVPKRMKVVVQVFCILAGLLCFQLARAVH
jgi:dipeptide/tripeptide permease